MCMCVDMQTSEYTYVGIGVLKGCVKENLSVKPVVKQGSYVHVCGYADK